MFIIGAGMAGLLAAHIFRNRQPIILEAQNKLPNNHEALLRFRSTKVADATGIPFKKVEVRKQIIYQGVFADKPNVFLANMYSRKVIGEVRGRSIWNMEPDVRYIAPHDFTTQMAKGVKIEYSAAITDLADLKDFSLKAPVISTIPMPVLMKIAGWNHAPQFNSLPIWSIQMDLVDPLVDVYQTIYYPDPEVAHYRASLTGSRLIIEFVRKPDDLVSAIDAILLDFGIRPWIIDSYGDLKEHRFGKIAPIADDARKDFMYTMTREHNVYSLGRFATWKQLLLDDVVGDCDVIRRLMEAEGRRRDYHQSLAIVGGKH